MIWYLLITIASLAAAYLVGTADRSSGAGLPAGSGFCVPEFSGAGIRGEQPARISSDWRSRPVSSWSVTRADALRRSGMFAIFLILFVPAALRQACGNDYMRYVEFFHLAYVDAYVPTEPGFNYFVKLVYTICGYENYLLVFALFAFATVALFLTAIRQQAQDFFASFFLFMMSGYYFRSYSTVRYYFALALALCALHFFLEREYIPYLALIVFAATFHKSVLCVLVLYPLAKLRWRKWQAGLLTAAGVLVMVFRTQVMQLIVRLYPSYEDTDILAAGGHISPANVLRCLLVLGWSAVCLMYAAGGTQAAAAGVSGGAEWNVRKEMACRQSMGDAAAPGRRSGRNIARAIRGAAGMYHSLPGSLLFYLNAAWLSLYIYLFAWFVPEVSRIAYYLVITQIFLVPGMLLKVPENRTRVRRILTILAAAAAVVMFAGFLVKCYDVTIRLLPYQTFLFHDLPQTPSRSIQ